jgi:hypothetical protein
MKMSNSLPDQAENAGREALDAANRSLKNASDGLHKLSEESAEALSAASQGAAAMIKQAGVRTADATEHVSGLLADEFKRHPAATFAAILGAFAAITSIVIATSKRLGRGQAG